MSSIKSLKIMKKISYLQFTILMGLLFFLSNCNSSKKLLESGQYSLAVEKSARRLQHDRDNEKQIAILIKAYPAANDKNISQINFLNKEGRADRWEKIYSNYAALVKRQNLVKTVTPLKYKSRLVKFDQHDYTDEMIEAKKNAAEFYYTNAKMLMQQNKKTAYRQAYNEFLKVKRYNAPEYSDLAKLIDEAYNKGLTKVVVAVENRSQLRLPTDFYSDITALDYDQLNGKWKKFIPRIDRYSITNYDYTAKIIIRGFRFSPERETEKSHTETRKIRDGFTYEYDARGNVKKDSLGNDIKNIKYKTISCNVVEVTQQKHLNLDASLEVSSNGIRKLLRSYPLPAAGDFVNNYYKIYGDRQALTPETLKRIGGKRLAFPTDMQMIHDAVPIIRADIARNLNQVKSAIR